MSQNGIPSDRDGAERDDRRPQPVAAGDQHVGTLRGEHECPVRVCRDGEQDRSAPADPGAPAPLEGAQEEKRTRATSEEQEQAVHPAVDAVEEEHPAARDERRRDQRSPRAR